MAAPRSRSRTEAQQTGPAGRRRLTGRRAEPRSRRGGLDEAEVERLLAALDRRPGRRLPGPAAGAGRRRLADGPAGHRRQRGRRAQPAPDRRAATGSAGWSAGTAGWTSGCGPAAPRAPGPAPSTRPTTCVDDLVRPRSRSAGCSARSPTATCPSASTCARATSGCAASSSGWPGPSTAWSTSCATFTDEVTRVAREVGTEGKLGGQARVRGVSGTWKDLTDSVNSMASQPHQPGPRHRAR